MERAEAYGAFNMGLGLVAVLRDGVAVPEGAILVGELVERQGAGLVKSTANRRDYDFWPGQQYESLGCRCITA